MKEKPRIHFLWLLLVISISFFILILSASSVSGNQFVVHTANNDYTAEVTNDNYIVFSEAGQKSWSEKIDCQIGSIAISPDGQYIAVGCDRGVISLYSTSWSAQLLWKLSFGDASIRSISFQENTNFIDATNVLNQAFLITRTGNLVNRPNTPAVTPVPSSTLSSIQKTSASTDYLPAKVDTNSIFGNSYFVWIVLAILILIVFWAIFSSHRKKGPTIIVPPPPQNGVIYAQSVPEGATIYLDGTYFGISPIIIPNLYPATYQIEAKLKGYLPNNQQIFLSPGQTAIYSPNLQKIPQKNPQPRPQPQPPKPKPKQPFQDLIIQLGAKTQKDREEAQKQLIDKVRTEGKSAIQQIIKELEKQPSGIKREIVNLLYYLSKESHEGQTVTEELINSLTYSSPNVKWLIIQTLGRLKDKRALSALEVAVSDTDFLVKYWAIISLKSIQES